MKNLPLKGPAPGPGLAPAAPRRTPSPTAAAASRSRPPASGFANTSSSSATPTTKPCSACVVRPTTSEPSPAVHGTCPPLPPPLSFKTGYPHPPIPKLPKSQKAPLQNPPRRRPRSNRQADRLPRRRPLRQHDPGRRHDHDGAAAQLGGPARAEQRQGQDANRQWACRCCCG
jgi:hypothetical protein